MASNGINKAIILGRVGKDVEMHYAANGNAIASFSVATGESWTDKNTQQKQEVTDWHNITIFGKLAEIAGQYVKKGDQVYLEGKIKTEKYTDKSGVEKYSTKVVLDSFSGVLQMLGSKSNDSQATQATPQQGYQPQPQNQAPQNQANQPQQMQQQQQQQQAPQGRQVGGGEYAPQAQAQPMNNEFDSDIPF